MSARQIQIRRGTEDEHANFTGAIGEITMDTTNNILRVHDGATMGGTVLAKKDEVPDINTMDYVVKLKSQQQKIIILGLDAINLVGWNKAAIIPCPVIGGWQFAGSKHCFTYTNE
ncbi:MAG: hypothetical protein ACOX7D_02180 [Alphaproteobacteria bacterium]|jgi:hypothetical protein